MTCTKAALWVPKTNSTTDANLTRRQTSDMRRQYILRAMPRRTFLLLVLLPSRTSGMQAPGPLRERLAARVAQAPATGVGLYYRSLTRPDSLVLGANLRFHGSGTLLHGRSSHASRAAAVPS